MSISIILLTLLLPIVLSIPIGSLISSSLSNTSALLPRDTDGGQPSDLQMMLFFSSGCSAAHGSSAWHKAINYGANNPVTITPNSGTFPTLSYYISRDLLPGEQLDWSMETVGPTPNMAVTNQDCGTFVQSTPNEAESQCIGAVGTYLWCKCYELEKPSTCLRLWKH